MTTPAVSIILSVFNGVGHLVEALDSILAQSFSDFEFIIVNDASTDTTSTILAGYANRDNRVCVLTNGTNMERSYSRNRAIIAADAPLIAVMDADDWAHPERIAKQYAFMQAHPEVTVCGTWLELYETGDVWQWPCDDAGIRAHMLFNSAIAHPTAMFRKEPVLRLVGGYDASKPLAEDYDLWVRLAAHAEVRFANLPELLLRYRTYPEKKRTEYREQLKNIASDIRRTLLGRLGLAPSKQEMAWHLALSGTAAPATLAELYCCWRWGRKLLAENARVKLYQQDAMHKYLRGALDSRLRCHPVHIFLRQIWRTYFPEFVRNLCRSPQKPLS